MKLTKVKLHKAGIEFTLNGKLYFFGYDVCGHLLENLFRIKK